MLVTHQSPMGVLDVPSLYRGEWVAGEEVEVTEEQARQLLEQHELYLPVDDEAKAIADELAAERDEPETPVADDPAPPAAAETLTDPDAENGDD